MKGSPEVRFWAKVDRREADQCWPWTAALQRDGYGFFNQSGRAMRLAHRVVYEMLVGEIPEGLQLDHLCRNRRCVNPAHLEPVTNAENQRRSRKSHCIRGHEMAGRNVYFGPRGRRCRPCAALWQRERNRRIRAALRELVDAA